MKTVRKETKIKNKDCVSSNTSELPNLDWIFDVSSIVWKPCWRYGGINLKSKIAIDSHLFTLAINIPGLVFWPFGNYWTPLMKTWRNHVKIKNSHWFSSDTWGIPILDWIFHLSVNIDNHCRRHWGKKLKSVTIEHHWWRHGRIMLKQK